MTTTQLVRTRVAPSPTGMPHIGTLLQSILDYVVAEQHAGSFIVRIEDTDQKRFVEGAEQAVYDALRWLGITPKESALHGGSFGPYRQSERLELYAQFAKQLVDQGDAYYCFCSQDRLEKIRAEQQAGGLPPKYDKHCRNLDPIEANQRMRLEPHVIRLKVPQDQTIVVEDVVRGSISFESSHIDDQVLMKSDGFPTYHLACVVDDHLMEISHVIRGEEWLSSAPKHVLLYDYFGWQKPIFFHTPTLRNLDKSKLSKRQGHTSVEWYIKEGFLPEALTNFLISIIWTHPEQKDIYSLEEVVKLFTFSSVHITGPIVDLQKLRWINGQYIRSMNLEQFVAVSENFLPPDFPRSKAMELLALVQERTEQLNQIEELTSFFYRTFLLDPRIIFAKADAQLVETQLSKTLKIIETTEWIVSEIESNIRTLQEEHDWHKRQFFMLLRYVSTGKTATPPLFETMHALGKTELLARLQKAQEVGP